MRILIAIDMECVFKAGYNREEISFIITKLLGEMFPHIIVHEKGHVKIDEKTYNHVSRKLWNILSILSKYTDVYLKEKYFRDTFLLLLFELKD